MKEENVYWVGTQPIGEKKTPVLADDPEFVAAISAACEAVGYPVARFISALGPYGTWLVEIQRAGQGQRILWNGKDACLVLQVPLVEGGWEDPVSIEVATQDTGGFVAGVNEIFSMAERENV
jgi:hypothetical protein